MSSNVIRSYRNNHLKNQNIIYLFCFISTFFYILVFNNGKYKNFNYVSCMNNKYFSIDFNLLVINYYKILSSHLCTF